MADKIDGHSKMLSKRLGQAIHNGELEHVRMYIEQGVDVNRQCDLAIYAEMFPLTLTCCHGHEEVVEELLKAGADPNQVSEMYGEMYPLGLACCHGHEEVVEELLKAGADPNQVSGWPTRHVMFMAAERGILTLSMMGCLISYGADVNPRDYRWMTILHILARGEINDTDDNILSAAKILLKNGASFYARDTNDCTPLYEACKCGNIDLVKLFIAEGANVNFNIGRMTMLTGAAEGCKIDMFDMLLNAGANRQLTPAALINPCNKNDHAMIEKILDTCDVDANKKLSDMTILQFACRYTNITSETVRLLLDRGSVRVVFPAGDTALHYAAMYYDCNKIRQLLSYNHPLNIKNSDNQTPLFKLTHDLIINYSQSRQQKGGFDRRSSLYQASLLAFKMLIIAGAKITADVEHNLNQFHIKHPEAQLPDYEICSTRSLKELCRFVIRGTIPVPVDVSLCKLPIPKLLQEYLNFTEFDQLLDEYNTHCYDC